MAAEPTKPVRIFYSYAHEDAPLLDKLKKQLASLKLRGLISEWYDRDISAGTEWDEEIAKQLDSAGVILLLISPDFIASDYCNNVEVKKAIERHEEGTARVIPIILRPVNWNGLPFSNLQALPSGVRPVTTWSNEDEAFLDIATGIEAAIKQLNLNSEPEVNTASVPHLSPLAYVEPESAVGFVARKDREGNDIIERLRAELAPRSSRVVALWGAGGVGKTALAAQAVRSLIADYHQRIAWISADGRDEFALPNLLDEISNQLGRSELRTLGLEVKRQAVHELVTATPTLIVLDNFETVKPNEQSRCLDWLTHLSPSSVLITTRAKIELPAIRNIPIKPMLAPEANEFLERLVQQAQHRRAFEHIDKDRLIATAEANPLILQWIFAQIDLAQDWREVLDELAQGEGDAAHRVFDRSFNLPLLNNGGRASLLALSLFVPSASRSALAEVAGLSGEKNKKKFKEATKHLAALWLIRTTEDGARLTVEGLTRDLAKARLGSDQRSVAIRQRFVNRFNNFASKNSTETASAFNALETERENVLAAIDVAFIREDWKPVLEIHDSIGPFLYLRGHLDEAIARSEKARVAALAINNKHALGIILENIATIRTARGEYVEAEQIYREALKVSRALNSDSEIAHTLLNLGTLQSVKGEFPQAKQLLRESLEIYERLDNQIGMARTMNALGDLANSQGDKVEARRLFLSGLEMLDNQGRQRETAIFLRSLGTLEQDKGELEAARRHYLDALELYSNLGNQMSISGVLGLLASVARQQGHINEALKLCGDSLDIEKQLDNKRGESATLHELGLIAFDRGQLAEAHRLFEQSLEIMKRLGDPIGIGMDLHELGNVYLADGELDSAEVRINQSLNTFRHLKARTFLAEALETLGRLKAAQGFFTEAHELYREALRTAVELEQKPIIAHIKHSTGLLAEKENNLTLATKLCHEALELYESLGFAKAERVKADLQRLERAEEL